ncbi:MAG: hypothetical protein WC405_04770 [Syntrophales bacterium]
MIPILSTPVFETDAKTGNFAYMVDSRGLMISYPNDYHIAGFAADGRPVRPLTEHTSIELTKKGEEVVNDRLNGASKKG